VEDRITVLSRKILETDDPDEVQAIGADLQDAIASHIEHIREKSLVLYEKERRKRPRPRKPQQDATSPA
jgi:hypothetical protein